MSVGRGLPFAVLAALVSMTVGARAQERPILIENARIALDVQ